MITNVAPHQHNSPYHPPQHLLDFPPEPAIYDLEFRNAFDCDTLIYPSRTPFVGQQFNTKEQM